jgi:nucleotide-binding universal stress UspA family protein
MKTILVATDFSPASNNAATYAMDMAMATNAHIVLLHVYQKPVTYPEVPVDYTEEDARLDAQESIGKQRDKILGECSEVVAVRTVLKEGDFVEELEKECAESQPDLVVMGSQGTTALERLVFGSHAVAAMKNLQWPMITVPLKARYNNIKNIGLACDFADVEATVPAEEIKQLVNEFKASLHVLNLAKKDRYDSKLVYGSGQLHRLLCDTPHEYHFLTNRDVDQGIAAFAEENKIDLLVVMPKTHGLIDKLLHRSHTKQLVLHCPVPVMALHQAN